MSILVGYVDTPEGHAALETGIAEATLRGERLVVVNSPRRGAPVDDDMVDGDHVRSLRTRAAEAGVDLDVRQPLHGESLADTLDALAREVDASLLVIGLRHRTPVGKLILGSTAQRILLESGLPVLTVKAPR
ncbi:universal stress protein [Phycicoccus sp. M110.8]|uniref:universal stress protein n=1 Tax=Phycicoccus sp. M110.8 TaxID=3075433 RepID=UPI0028FDBBA8|nr:universal stress protein [Phycicoccus sp. M110.8]MDU0315052.1 universal stress protein [Phycicoccus sp. M110.8]